MNSTVILMNIQASFLLLLLTTDACYFSALKEFTVICAENLTKKDLLEENKRVCLPLSNRLTSKCPKVGQSQD